MAVVATGAGCLADAGDVSNRSHVYMHRVSATTEAREAPVVGLAILALGIFLQSLCITGPSAGKKLGVGAFVRWTRLLVRVRGSLLPPSPGVLLDKCVQLTGFIRCTCS